jgi:putative flavoprotein involved in K+ transport
MPEREPEQIETVVIGGGQAGLSVGYHLARRDRPFVILDASQRVGDAWRKRWDSLRLFTPARYDGLAGIPFPAPACSFPSKDQVADYLEAYAAHFELPVQTGVRVDRLSRHGDRFVVAAGDRRFEADHVVVAMATYQVPSVPAFAPELDPGVVQLHAGEYRNPSQLQEGGVLVVGAGNSGAEIALEVAGGHPTWLAGKESGHVPFRIEGAAARHIFQPLLFRVIGHRVLTVDTPIGRKLRPRLISHGAPLVRVKPKDLAAAGIQRVPRVVGVRDGRPLLEDRGVLEVANVVWCTGFRPDFSWIDLPVFGETEPMHHRGIVANAPGLYFVGLAFLYAMSSGFLPGVGRDAEHIANHIASRQLDRRPAAQEPAAAQRPGVPDPAQNGVARPHRTTKLLGAQPLLQRVP